MSRRIIHRSLPITWITNFVLWLIFADNYGSRELVTGAVAAALATYFVELFSARTREHFRMRIKYVAQAVHIPALLSTDTWILMVAIKRRMLGQKLPGGIVAVHFRSGADTPVSRARRSLAITYLTLTPNTLVFDISTESQLLFFHTLIRRPVPSFLKIMGAELGHS